MREKVIWLALLLAALLGAMAATPLLIALPSVPTPSAPGQFDATRAKARLAFLLADEHPHPADTPADDAVRVRLTTLLAAMGLRPIVRDQFACNQIYKMRGVSCTRVRNVIVRLGPTTGKAVLLNAHYDSVAAGPGASDDGAGVATLLDVASILKDQPLRRPVILLFNEGEELGLVGARAFLADPLSQNIDSLINLEARGTTGPAVMFETSVPNGPALRAFSRALRRPYASSLATDFYRLLPNSTDVNSFSERGWLTLNFAMIGNETRYHSPGDDLAALDIGSLKSMGDQTLALTRELASSEPSDSGTLLFADVAGRQLIVLPQWAGFVLLGLLTVGFGWIANRRGCVGHGLALMLGLLVGSGLLAWLGMLSLGVARPGSFWRGYPFWIHLSVWTCGTLAAIAGLAFAGRNLTLIQLRCAFWLAFLLIGVAVAGIAPGGVIYFLFPPLAVLMGRIGSHWLKWAERLGALLAAAMLWLMLGEIVALLSELLNNGPMFIFAPLAVLITMPWLIEVKPLIDGVRPRWAIAPPALFLLLAWTTAAATPAYSADRQQRFVIQHITEGNTAWWSVANDGKPLPSNYGGVANWHWAKLPLLDGKRWIAAASLNSAQVPQLEILGSSSTTKLRTISFRVHSNGAEEILLIGDRDSQILTAGSGSFIQPIQPRLKGPYYLQCSGRSCDGAILQFTTTVQTRMRFTLIGMAPGLPASGAQLLRLRSRFARPQYAPDSTVSVSSIWL